MTLVTEKQTAEIKEIDFQKENKKLTEHISKLERRQKMMIDMQAKMPAANIGLCLNGRMGIMERVELLSQQEILANIYNPVSQEFEKKPQHINYEPLTVLFDIRKMIYSPKVSFIFHPWQKFKIWCAKKEAALGILKFNLYHYTVNGEFTLPVDPKYEPIRAWMIENEVKGTLDPTFDPISDKDKRNFQNLVRAFDHMKTIAVQGNMLKGMFDRAKELMWVAIGGFLAVSLTAIFIVYILKP